jgi:hypothetical protein
VRRWGFAKTFGSDGMPVSAKNIMTAMVLGGFFGTGIVLGLYVIGNLINLLLQVLVLE